MTYMILACGKIKGDEIKAQFQEGFSCFTVDFDPKAPLNIYSLLANELRLSKESDPDDPIGETVISNLYGAHSALLFPNEGAMNKAKIVVHGFDGSQWAEDTGQTHGIRISANVEQETVNEVARLGAELHRLMTVEVGYRDALNAVDEQTHCDDETREQIRLEAEIPLRETQKRRAEVTKRLIEIQWSIRG